MATPLVSIGIPAYNGARHLAEALESARAQAYGPLEIIVSDDGSSDDTEAIGRRFAALDARVVYVRQPRNVGAAANFRCVRDLARGAYFTWLAQDDSLSDPHYVSTVVDFLERNPDVVCCMCSLHMLDYELAGTRSLAQLPMLAPNRPWVEARAEFFRWPQSDAQLAIYGMFRRADLAQIPIVTRSHRGRPTSAWWEMPVLAALAARGRIVAIPPVLRTKRLATGTDGWRTYQMSAPFDLCVVGMRTKLSLLRLAWQIPVPSAQRAALLRLTLGGLFRSNLRRPHDPRVLIGERRRELTRLKRVAEERAQLIGSLRRAIAERVEILLQSGGRVDDYDGTSGAAISTASATGLLEAPTRRSNALAGALNRYDRSSESLVDFFRPAPHWVLELCQELNEEIGRTRRHCEEQLVTINRLHLQAVMLLERMIPQNSAPPPSETEPRSGSTGTTPGVAERGAHPRPSMPSTGPSISAASADTMT